MTLVISTRPGSYTTTAVYSGDANFAPATSPGHSGGYCRPPDFTVASSTGGQHLAVQQLDPMLIYGLLRIDPPALPATGSSFEVPRANVTYGAGAVNPFVPRKS